MARQQTNILSPSYETEACHNQVGYVIGVDEAGRGPWAGPVCAAAFWIDPHHLDMIPTDLTDSKKLSAVKRAAIERSLSQSPHMFRASFASVAEIDEMGILPANFKAMREAVQGVAARLLSEDPLGFGDQKTISLVLIDGNICPEIGYPAKAIIKGDSRILSIAAASIIAKQSRDHHMAELHKAYPAYGWERNQGYGTKAHREALEAYGVTEHHRRSFAPIKKLLTT